MGLCERFPAINLAHADLCRRKQGLEQHGGGVDRSQYGLRLDPPLKLLCNCPMALVARTFSLARRQPYEAEQALTLLRAVGNGAMLEPPLADEGLAACRVVVVGGGDLLVQPFGRICPSGCGASGRCTPAPERHPRAAIAALRPGAPST